MSKQKTLPRFPDNYALAFGRMLRVSPQKLNLVAQMIRGLSAEKALRVLSFSPKRIAVDVKKVLASAVANAENNQGLNVGRLVVVEATVGRALVMRRLDVRGRSKSGRIEKPFSHLRIVVCEPEEV
jgi:large subunit ribosomal protein L22